MRTKRLVITAENYESLKKVVNSLPPHAKGNDTVREAMNISAGTWSYLRNSKDFEEFKTMRNKANKPVKVATDGEIKPRPSMVQFPESAMMTAGSLSIVLELKTLNKNLVRLCEAWESTPAKKGLFK